MLRKRHHYRAFFPSVSSSSTDCSFHRKQRRGFDSLVGRSTTSRIHLSPEGFRACGQERAFRVFTRFSLAVGRGLFVFINHQSHVIQGRSDCGTPPLSDGLASRPVYFFPGPEDCVAPTRSSPLANAAHSLMSCDSDILASVFFTRRAVRRDPGLWAQHSVMSFPICLKHCKRSGISLAFR